MSSPITYTNTNFANDFVNNVNTQTSIAVSDDFLQQVDYELASQKQPKSVRDNVKAQLLDIAGKDRVISGNEVDKLFKLLDSFDKNGSSKSFIKANKTLCATSNTVAGDLLDTFKAYSVKADVLTSNQLVDRFAGSCLDVSDISLVDRAKLLVYGITANKLRDIAGKDGVISSEAEFAKVFDAIDAKDEYGKGVISTAVGIAGQDDLKTTNSGEVMAIISKYCKKSQTMSRESFISVYNAGMFDLSKLSKNDMKTLENMGLKTILDHYSKNGTISGTTALTAIYSALNGMDGVKTGDLTLAKPMAAGQTPTDKDMTKAGQALNILKNCFEISGFIVHKDLSRALVDPSVKEVHLVIANITQPPNSRDCQKCSREDITTTYKHVTTSKFCSGENTHCMAETEDSTGNIRGRKQDFTDGRKYIDACLDAGIGVVVGTSYKDDNYNNDHITDHFVCITGRGVDKSGRVYYEYNDPATCHDGTTGKFYVDQDTNMLFTGDFKRGAKGTRINYSVSRIDPYNGVIQLNNGKSVDLSFKTVIGHNPVLAYKR